MLPIGIMMIEHRLIERMFGVMRQQSVRVRETRSLDGTNIAGSIEFIRVYIDKSHHGKEEELLFKPLLDKAVTRELRDLTSELIAEHDRARNLLSGLAGATARFRQGAKEAHTEISAALETLPVFYAAHIEKEDRHFFFPAMTYFTRDEQADMIAANNAYDLRVFHEVWKERVEALEQKTG